MLAPGEMVDSLVAAFQAAYSPSQKDSRDLVGVEALHTLKVGMLFSSTYYQHICTAVHPSTLLYTPPPHTPTLAQTDHA